MQRIRDRKRAGRRIIRCRHRIRRPETDRFGGGSIGWLRGNRSVLAWPQRRRGTLARKQTFDSMDRFDKFTDRARKVLTLAQDEAQRFNHNYIGTEHLLLGLVREGEGVAARVLENMNVELAKVQIGRAHV